MGVRVGVIGVGVMGAEHVRLLNDEVSGGEVSAVYDLDRARAEATGVKVFDDPLALIADESVDAVLIASADATHEQFVLASLGAGKPVLCEKPMAPDVDGCRRILDAEVMSGRRLVSVGFMRRFDAGYAELKTALPAVGRPLMVHCVHRNTSASLDAAASGSITQSAVHEIDIVRWLLGEEIATVTVHAPRRSVYAGANQDPLLVLLQTVSGVLVDVEVFLNARYGYEVRCEVVAEDGTVALDAVPPTVRRSAQSVGYGLPVDWRPRFADSYRRELQTWIDGITAGSPAVGASAWDGYVATAVAAAGVAALDGGTRAVELIERPALYT